MIVGLGNPGTQYVKTKHNVGFMVVDMIAETVEHTPWKDQCKAEVASCMIGDEKVMLVKPMTFMNASGEAVGPLMRYFKIAPEDIFCIYDDMDLPIGKLRIRPNGGSGGHKGIKSLVTHIGSEGFIRFRLGIGRPLPQWTVVDHVLAPFSEEDQEVIEKGVKTAAKAVIGTVQLGIEMGMNRYNPRRG